MKTTIDNNQRVFLISRDGFSTRDYFCNIHEIPTCINDLEKNDSFKIYHYWNKKLTRISKKSLNELFAANQINFKL